MQVVVHAGATAKWVLHLGMLLEIHPVLSGLNNTIMMLHWQLLLGWALACSCSALRAHLQESCVVTYIHEPQATQVSVPVHPAAHCDVFTDICLCHITSSMTPGRPAH